MGLLTGWLLLSFKQRAVHDWKQSWATWTSVLIIWSEVFFTTQMSEGKLITEEQNSLIIMSSDFILMTPVYHPQLTKQFHPDVCYRFRQTIAFKKIWVILLMLTHTHETNQRQIDLLKHSVQYINIYNGHGL